MLRWLKIGCWSTVVKIQKVKIDYNQRWSTVQTVSEVENSKNVKFKQLLTTKVRDLKSRLSKVQMG
ncbi:hypothetical protein HanXRQr2_Chr09g0398611 [Helianthus annuus]|uniref:Uncharacterized protein n=1 Tax=Helianthus annuus TaxID=4232 RepID=A0A251TYR1_HELAN|nr:hypothetical protein HanXRQr2_Chr09g0398611 [Helianthus annuus]KAJ0894020.1 hypothetical protein HanPSC8_Chr09g0384371 [Helianthus annuus]